MVCIPFIAEQLPIKQGLKQSVISFELDRASDRRATSNKTRIETLKWLEQRFFYIIIAEQLPIKQGLKLIFAASSISYRSSQSNFQ